jgi:hypothetical protein
MTSLSTNCEQPLRTKSYSGWQRAEAFAFAINLVNDMVRGTVASPAGGRGRKTVALDGHAVDSCRNEISAVQATLDAVLKFAPVSGIKTSLDF